MSDNVKEFLEKIGPRALTQAESRQLHILRLKEGASGNSAVAQTLAAQKTAADDGKKSR